MGFLTWKTGKLLSDETNFWSRTLDVILNICSLLEVIPLDPTQVFYDFICFDMQFLTARKLSRSCSPRNHFDDPSEFQKLSWKVFPVHSRSQFLLEFYFQLIIHDSSWQFLVPRFLDHIFGWHFCNHIFRPSLNTFLLHIFTTYFWNKTSGTKYFGTHSNQENLISDQDILSSDQDVPCADQDVLTRMF